MFKASLTLLGGAALFAISGCAQQDEPAPVVYEPTPIYAKDGTVIGTRPPVSPGASTDPAMVDMDDMEEED